MDKSIQIVDNFLPDDVFYPFAHTCMQGHHFMPMDGVSVEEESVRSISSFGEDLTPTSIKNFAEVMFQSVFFSREPLETRVSDMYLCHPHFFNLLEELLNVKRWWRIRLNCTVGQDKQHFGKYHRDFNANHGKFFADTKTSILYINTNNGGTQFRGNSEIVKSKKNRLITFPTFTWHRGVWSTDAKLRFVLNMTYETK